MSQVTEEDVTTVRWNLTPSQCLLAIDQVRNSPLTGAEQLRQIRNLLSASHDSAVTLALEEEDAWDTE